MKNITETRFDEDLGKLIDSGHSFSYQIWFFDGLKSALNGQLPLATGKLKRKRGTKIARAYKAGYHAGQQIQLHTTESDFPNSDLFSSKVGGNTKEWFVRGLLDSAMGHPPKNESILRCRYGDEAANAYWEGYEALPQG